MYLGNYNFGDSVTVDVSTHNPSTGALADALSDPTLHIHESDGTLLLSTTIPRSKLGQYVITIPILAASGYVLNTRYYCDITATMAGGIESRVYRSFEVGGNPLVEAGFDLVKCLRLMTAFMFGLNTSTEIAADRTKTLTFRDINDLMDRVIMKVDSKANRLTITLDGGDTP